MAKIPIKIDCVHVFNQVIGFINKTGELRDAAEQEEDARFDALPWREMSTIDVKFQIIMQHLESVAMRAIELKDPQLIEHLMNMGAITETKDETKAASVAEDTPPTS